MQATRKAPTPSRPPKSNPQETELVEHARNADASVVLALLELGVSPNCQTELGTPLIAACEAGSVTVAELLLAQGADPNVLARDGNYPLRAAILCGDGEVINALLGHAATNPNLTSPRGTPLIVASGTPPRCVRSAPLAAERAFSVASATSSHARCCAHALLPMVHAPLVRSMLGSGGFGCPRGPFDPLASALLFRRHATQRRVTAKPSRPS